MGKYLDIVKRFEAQRQAEGRTEPQRVVSVASSPQAVFHTDAREEPVPEASPWTCRYCSQPLTIDDVFPSLDGERLLTLWRCDPCQLAGVTPDAIQKPPTVWVKTIQQ